MKRCAFFMLALIIASGSLVAQPASAGQPEPESEWLLFNSKEGRFSVEMPGEPSYLRKTTESPVGAVEEVSFSLSSSGVDFTAEFADLPGTATIFGSDRVIYRKARRALLKEAGGTESGSEKFLLGGYGGLELSYDVPAKGGAEARQGRARFVLVGSRLYVVAVEAPRGEEFWISSDRFLDSFRIAREKTREFANKYLGMRPKRCGPGPSPE